MTMQMAWELSSFRVNPQTNRVSIANWTLTFTDPDNFPGVESRAGGITPVDLDADTATTETILDAVRSFMSPQMAQMEAFNAHQLEFLHRQKVAELEVPVGTPEQLRAKMPPLSPRQIRLALLTEGITEEQVDTALADNPAGLIEWKYATQYERTHSLIAAMGLLFSLSDEEIDDLWKVAATL